MSGPQISFPGKMLVDKPELSTDESFKNIAHIVRNHVIEGKTLAEVGKLWCALEASLTNVGAALELVVTQANNIEKLKKQNEDLQDSLSIYLMDAQETEGLGLGLEPEDDPDPPEVDPVDPMYPSPVS